MKFKIGQPDYPFKTPGKIKGIRIVGQRGKDIDLLPLTMAQMNELHRQHQYMRAMPVYWAYDQANETLWFHPNPNSHAEYYVMLHDRTATGPVPPVAQQKSSNTLSLPKRN